MPSAPRRPDNGYQPIQVPFDLFIRLWSRYWLLITSWNNVANGEFSLIKHKSSIIERYFTSYIHRPAHRNGTFSWYRRRKHHSRSCTTVLDGVPGVVRASRIQKVPEQAVSRLDRFRPSQHHLTSIRSDLFLRRKVMADSMHLNSLHTLRSKMRKSTRASLKARRSLLTRWWLTS